MINFTRRKRQANENAKYLVDGFFEHIDMCKDICIFEKQSIDNEKILDTVLEKLESELIAVAETLEADWAIPIVIEVIGNLYYGKFSEHKAYGNVFKRLLAYLWKAVYTKSGGQKNLHQLLQAVLLSYSVEMLYAHKKMFSAILDFRFEFHNGYIDVPEKFNEKIMRFGALNRGRGKRMRVAEVNSYLINSRSDEFLKGVLGVLNGEVPNNIEIFKGTFYENIPGIADEECKKFWQEIFFRFFVYINALAQSKEDENGTEVILFHEFALGFPQGYCTQETVENSFWKTAWFNEQDPERYGNLIVDKPILRISRDGDFVTSAVLIGDSINSFVEKQLFGYVSRSPKLNLPQDIFKNAFSEQFENECIDFFRSRGFLAGHVTPSEVWKTQNGNINLKSVENKLYGEIDVLAYNKQLNMIFLIECKVLNDCEDSRTYKNLVVKLKNDSESFASKLNKKAKWLVEAFALHYNLKAEYSSIILTDIPLPVLDTKNKNILYADFETLKETLDEIIDEYV